jgi:hypothetical protein
MAKNALDGDIAALHFPSYNIRGVTRRPAMELDITYFDGRITILYFENSYPDGAIGFLESAGRRRHLADSGNLVDALNALGALPSQRNGSNTGRHDRGGAVVSQSSQRDGSPEPFDPGDNARFGRQQGGFQLPTAPQQQQQPAAADDDDDDVVPSSSNNNSDNNNSGGFAPAPTGAFAAGGFGFGTRQLFPIQPKQGPAPSLATQMEYSRSVAGGLFEPQARNPLELSFRAVDETAAPAAQVTEIDLLLQKEEGPELDDAWFPQSRGSSKTCCSPARRARWQRSSWCS